MSTVNKPMLSPVTTATQGRGRSDDILEGAVPQPCPVSATTVKGRPRDVVGADEAGTQNLLDSLAEHARIFST